MVGWGFCLKSSFFVSDQIGTTVDVVKRDEEKKHRDRERERETSAYFRVILINVVPKNIYNLAIFAEIW